METSKHYRHNAKFHQDLPIILTVRVLDRLPDVVVGIFVVVGTVFVVLTVVAVVVDKMSKTQTSTN